MKKKKIILSLIIICLVMLAVIGIIYYYAINKEQQIKENKVLSLTGFGVIFEQYEGDLTTGGFAVKLEEITTKHLPETYDEVKNYDEAKLKSYYIQNSSQIKSNFGITKFSQFSELIAKIKQTNIDIATWESLGIIKESLTNESDKSKYAYVEYEVTYENDQKIIYTAYLIKQKSNLPEYIIGVK